MRRCMPLPFFSSPLRQHVSCPDFQVSRAPYTLRRLLSLTNLASHRRRRRGNSGRSSRHSSGSSGSSSNGRSSSRSSSRQLLRSTPKP